MRLGEILERRGLSLQVVIAATVLLGVICATAVAYFYAADRLKEQHLVEVQSDLAQVTNLTVLAMREPLWNFVPEGADSIIDSLFVNPGIVSIEVLDQTGAVFAYRYRPGFQALKDKGLVISTLRKVVRDGTDIGQIVVAMSTSGYLTKLTATRGQFLRMAIWIATVALLIIMTLLQFNFVRPINRLVKASERLAMGKFDEPISASGLVELGTLADSLETTRQALVQLVGDLEKGNAELTAANANLETRVQERTHSLATAIDELRRAQEEIIQSEKLTSLGRIVAMVAHELNTPIGNAKVVASTIAQNLQDMQAEINSPSPRKSRLVSLAARNTEGALVLIRSMDRASELISNFKQMAVDQTSDQRRAFDLANVTREVLSTIDAFARKSSCVLVPDCEPGIACNGYPGAYGRMLTNLVMNAVVHGYHDSAGGKIFIVVKSVTGGKASLAVRDEGLGMSAEVKRKIFDPFFTTKMGQGGSGLGMNVVHGIATKTLDGTISVNSEEGKGTEVLIVFPTHSPAGKGGADHA